MERSIELPGGFHIPRRYVVEVDDPRRGVFLTIRVVIEDGQPVCDELTVKRTRTASISGGERFPLKSYLRGSMASVATRVSKGQSGRRAPLRPEDTDEFYRALAGPRPRLPMQRRGVDRDRLVEVARLYRAAVEDGEDPGPRIAKELHYSKGYARRLAMKARSEGLLGPAQRGRAGEEK